MSTRNRTRGREESGGLAYLYHPAAVALLLSLLATAIYVNALGHGFVFDDLGLVVSNKQIQNINGLLDLFTSGGWRTYRPVRTASYAIDYGLFGLNPAGFRGFNVFYHVLNGTLLFFIFRTILGQPRPALLAAVLFIVHPIQTDSVTYISGRRDLLFTLFYLIGFYAFIRYRLTARLFYLGLAGVAYYLGLLSKEMAITLPLLCLSFDLTRALPAIDADGGNPWQALKRGAQLLIEQHKWLVLSAVGLSGVVASYYVFVFIVSRQREMWGGGLWPTLLTGTRIVVHYLGLLVFPATLNADYSYNAFPISYSPADVRVLFAIIVLGAVWWGIYRLLAFDRWAAFGGLWFFLTLLPVSQIIPHHEMLAEHYLYLPSAGFFLMIALLVERAFVRGYNGRVVFGAFALIVLLLAARTVVRNFDWKDDLTLWTKTVQTAPESARAHTNLGEAHMRRNRFVEAEQEFREALRIQPDDAVNLANHGLSLLRLGQLDEAEGKFRVALQSLPRSETRINLGLVLLKRGRFDEAEQEFRGVLQSGEGQQQIRILALNNLGLAAVLKGRVADAEQAFEEAIRLDGRNAEVRGNLGRLYLERGQYREAAIQLQEAVRLHGAEANFHRMLGEAYYYQGMKELAAIELTKALTLRMDLPEAKMLLNKIGQERASERGRRG